MTGTRAGNDEDESWNGGERAKEMTERKQRENSGKGEGGPGEGRMKDG